MEKANCRLCIIHYFLNLRVYKDRHVHSEVHMHAYEYRETSLQGYSPNHWQRGQLEVSLERGRTLRHFFLIYLFIYGCVWVFVSVRGLSLVVASGGHSSSQCAGLSVSRPLLLRSTGSRRAGSVVVAHGPTCSAACGIFPDQGSNPCPLQWQADS